MTVDLGGEVDRVAPVPVAVPSVSVPRPWAGLPALWVAACGALAGAQGEVARAALLPLGFTLLAVSLGWVAGWQILAGTDWLHSLAHGWPPRRPARLPRLPYTRPRAPAGRLWRGAANVAGWWREAFWPQAGVALAGLATASVLAALFGLLLAAGPRPGADNLRLLAAIYVALGGIALAWRRHGRDWPAGQAAAVVALPWLAGHLAVAPATALSAGLALALALAWWGTERLARRLAGSAFLIGAGQAGVMAALVALEQPLAAAAAGALLLPQLALLPAAAAGADAGRMARRTRPWLLAVMLLAAVALP